MYGNYNEDMLHTCRHVRMMRKQ